MLLNSSKCDKELFAESEFNLKYKVHTGYIPVQTVSLILLLVPCETHEELSDGEKAF